MLMANETSAPARLVLLGGKPIKEPVQQYGPFVMTTPEEVRQAMIDYQVGSGEKQPLSLSLSLTHTHVYIYIYQIANVLLLFSSAEREEWL